MKAKKIIAIDFDGTIAETNFPDIIKPISGAIKTITDLYNSGHTLILWTCREGESLAQANSWLRDMVIADCFSEINTHTRAQIEEWGTNPRKVAADVYIDDRACGWDGWESVRKYFELD